MPGDVVREFLEQNPGCLWIVDKLGVLRHVFGDSSRYLGRPADQLRGKRFPEIVDSAEGPVWEHRIARVFCGERLSVRERRLDDIWYVSIFPVRIDSEVVYAAGVAREVTPWTSAERDLR